MSNLASDETVEYSLSGPDTRGGLYLLFATSIVCFCLALWLGKSGNSKNAIVVGLFAVLMAGVGLFGLARLRANISYKIDSNQFVVKDMNTTKVHALSELAHIKLTAIGAGDASPGSYKVVFKDSATYWFHAFGRAEEFVKHLSKASGISISG